MPMPYLEAHTINPDGTTRGSYSHVPCTFRNISSKDNAIEVHHSLFEGDRMTFYQVIQSREEALDVMRPIRFYNNDPDIDGVKLFDGMIFDSEYTYVGTNYMVLRVNAIGWWRELARMDLHHPIEYGSTWTVNEIYEDLVRLANDYGVMKEAVYTYDTAKIPEYGTYDDYYEAAIGTEFVVNNIYQGMKRLTQVLDATVPCTYEFGLRVEALPRLDGIDQNDTKTKIYILPFVINQDKTEGTTFERFHLATGYNVKRDYSRLANDCFAVGNGCHTQQIRTHKILDEGEITSDNTTFHIPPADQPLESHYLRVTITNHELIPTNGTVEFTFIDGVDEIIEKIPMNLKNAPGLSKAVHTHFTSQRSHDGIKDYTGIRCRGFGGWIIPITITVEEVTTGGDLAPPDSARRHTTIAGKSLNNHGHAPHTIERLWLNTQAQVDLIAGKHCRLYHNPVHELYAPVIERYISYDNLIGNVAKFYSPYRYEVDKFLVTDAIYGFRGDLVTQHLLGIRHEFSWDYDGTNIYVLSGTDYVMADTNYVVI